MTQSEIMRAIVALISYTGKSGKSTLANNLLHPRMQAKMFWIETINESGLSDAGDNEQRLKGRDIEKLMLALSKTDAAIVDIGSSNVEPFFMALTQQPDSHRIFDYFVVPIEANASKVNEFKEAVKTLTMEGLAEFRKPLELAAIWGRKIESSLPKCGKIQVLNQEIAARRWILL